MASIAPDPLSLTTHHLHICFSETILSSGSGFIYKHQGTHYLITNWHNVSGRNPITGKCLSTTLAIPDMISTLFRSKEQLGNCKREHLSLYRDSQMEFPAWYEHPSHGRSVDVVALPIPESISNQYELFPINSIELSTEFKEEVADEAFVIGYPFSEITHAQLPIWKRASIATEPDVDIDQLPKIFIDTATRPGLSGSPVIMQRVGIHGMRGSTISGDTIFGRIRSFLGVYSGRIGKDELQAQLGIVWKARVIAEIIEGSVYGKTTTTS